MNFCSQSVLFWDSTQPRCCGNKKKSVVVFDEKSKHQDSDFFTNQKPWLATVVELDVKHICATNRRPHNKAAVKAASNVFLIQWQYLCSPFNLETQSICQNYFYTVALAFVFSMVIVSYLQGDFLGRFRVLQYAINFKLVTSLLG